MGAKAGTLTFMAGGVGCGLRKGANRSSERWASVSCIAASAGAGQAAKICNNMILGVSMIAVSEAFVLAREAWPVASGAVRGRLDIVGPVLVADHLLPRARSGADLAGQ